MLKLRKLKGGLQWKGIISYKDKTTEFTDPSQVEEYVNAGKMKDIVHLHWLVLPMDIRSLLGKPTDMHSVIYGVKGR